MRALFLAGFLAAISSSAVLAAELTLPGGRSVVERETHRVDPQSHWTLLPGCYEVSAPALIHCHPSPPADPTLVLLKTIRGPHREPYGTLYPSRRFGSSLHIVRRAY